MAEEHMSESHASEKAILFLNNLAGDDLWEHFHLMMPKYGSSSAPSELLRFTRTARDTNNRPGIHVTSVPYNLRRYGRVRLYGFPFLTSERDPFDVEYPCPVHGLIISQDMRMFEFFMDESPEFFDIADMQFSRLAWARKQNLPTILAVHHADGYTGDIETLSKLIGMEVFCPVVWHAGDINAPYLQECIHSVLSEIRQI